MGIFGTKIRVTYIDADTDAVMSAGNVNIRRLPDSFDHESVVRVNGHQCQVVRATPRTKPEFTEEGTLLLQVRRLDQMLPGHKVFGYPTLCSDPTEVGEQAADKSALQIKRDHWRQLEFVSQDLMLTVNNELRQIRMVRQSAATEMGWKKYYSRKRPTIPVTSGIKLSVVTSKFSALDRVRPVTFEGEANIIPDGFAFEIDRGAHLYGLAPHGEILVMAIVPIKTVGLRGITAQKVMTFARDFRLDLVAWCDCKRLEPDHPEFVDFLSS